MRKYARPSESQSEISEYNTIRVKEAVETGKGLKRATNKEECKAMILSLKEEDRSIATNRQRILERCAEFYQKLYEVIRTTSQKWR